MASSADLAPNPRNPRQITDDRVERLRRSLAEFGDLSGVIKNVRSGLLIGGHQRCRAWDRGRPGEIEYTERLAAPNSVGTVAYGRIRVGDEAFAYREVDWDADREKAANLAANRAAGEWDSAALEAYIRELNEADYDLRLTMLDDVELKEILGDDLKPEAAAGEGDGAAEPADEAPEKAATGVVRGEIYALGRHRLMCGDSLNDGDVARLVGGRRVDLVFTDPPYGMHLETDYSGMHQANESGKGGNTYTKVIGDDAPYDPAHLFRQMPKSAEMVLWGADYYRRRLPEGGSWYCWDKRLSDNMDRVLGNVFELAWSRTPHKREVARILWSGHHGLQGEDTHSRVHPTQKPVALLRWFFERLEGEVVADLFAGSGSTLIACEQSRRTCLALEMDPAYCQVIISRWEKLTGQKAERCEAAP